MSTRHHKVLYVIILQLAICPILYAQELIVAEKQVLSTIKVGAAPKEVSYSSSEDGFYSPEGPMIDQDGRLLFYPSTTRDRLITYYKGRWEVQPLYGFLIKTTGNQ
ncbi:MAG: hypothetical protein Q7I93_03780, partial [Syntrophales bacterium]|nr:hypothetical protein [Syntrophales bacterium]